MPEAERLVEQRIGIDRMNLHVFDRKAQREWIDTGYRFIKLSASKNIGFQDFFILLEPYSGEEDIKLHKDIVHIQSAEIEKIIAEKSGKYAK